MVCVKSRQWLLLTVVLIFMRFGILPQSAQIRFYLSSAGDDQPKVGSSGVGLRGFSITAAIFYPRPSTPESQEQPSSITTQHGTASSSTAAAANETPSQVQSSFLGETESQSRKQAGVEKNETNVERIQQRPVDMASTATMATPSSLQEETVELENKPSQTESKTSTSKNETMGALASASLTEKENKDDTPVNNMDTNKWATEFHFCNRPVLGNVSQETAHMEIWYQCQGEEYEKFATQLHAFVRNNQTQQQRPPTWGRRPHPLPDHSRVLIFGNSHARQIGLALACQAADDLQQVVRYDTHLADPHMAQRFVFGNNATLFLVANSYAAYSPHWVQLLEQQMDARLADMDAVLLGVFNRNRGVSNFVLNMQEMMKQLPAEYNVDLEYPNPSVHQVAAALNRTGQALAVSSMFGEFQQAVVRHAAKETAALQQSLLQQQQNGTDFPLVYMNARRYLEQMSHNGSLWEGGSASKLEPGPCFNGREALKMHRCMGRHGGHADLIAWDLSEFVYDTMSGQTNYLWPAATTVV